MMLFMEAPPDNILVWLVWIMGGLLVSSVGAVLFLAKRKPERLTAELTSGEVSESKWILNITQIVRTEITELRTELRTLMKEGFEETHKARNSLLALHGKVDEAERNIIEAVKNGKH